MFNPTRYKSESNHTPKQGTPNCKQINEIQVCVSDGFYEGKLMSFIKCTGDSGQHSKSGRCGRYIQHARIRMDKHPVKAPHLKHSHSTRIAIQLRVISFVMRNGRCTILCILRSNCFPRHPKAFKGLPGPHTPKTIDFLKEFI